MLYSSFRVSVMIAAIFGLLHMIAEGQFLYVFFLIVIIIWAVFSLFNDEDREYLRRNGINPDDISGFFPEYSDYGIFKPNNSSSRRNDEAYKPRNYKGGFYGAQNNPYNENGYRWRSNPEYKKLKDKCKRNFKITISKDTETDETENDGL